jgi:hypothetical protein
VAALCRYDHTGFKTPSDSPLIQNVTISHRKLAEKYVTRQFPHNISTIDEATVMGNITGHVDIPNTLLLLTHEQLSNLAIRSFINDKLESMAPKLFVAVIIIHSLEFKVFRIGLFHLCLNLI